MEGGEGVSSFTVIFDPLEHIQIVSLPHATSESVDSVHIVNPHNVYTHGGDCESEQGVENCNPSRKSLFRDDVTEPDFQNADEGEVKAILETPVLQEEEDSSTGTGIDQYDEKNDDGVDFYVLNFLQIGPEILRHLFQVVDGGNRPSLLQTFQVEAVDERFLQVQISDINRAHSGGKKLE